MANAPLPHREADARERTYGLETRELISPEAAAAQAAAQADYLRRRNPGQYAPLPNGQMIQVMGAFVHKYPGAKVAAMIARPRDILKDPKPDFGREMPRYQWRIRQELGKEGYRDRETAQVHSSGRVRYVETSEVNLDSPLAVHEEFAAPGGKYVYVTCKTFILCEIMDPAFAYESYKAWTDLSLSRLQSLPEEVAAMPETHRPGKVETTMTVQQHGPGDV